MRPEIYGGKMCVIIQFTCPGCHTCHVKRRFFVCEEDHGEEGDKVEHTYLFGRDLVGYECESAECPFNKTIHYTTCRQIDSIIAGLEELDVNDDKSKFVPFRELIEPEQPEQPQIARPTHRVGGEHPVELPRISDILPLHNFQLWTEEQNQYFGRSGPFAPANLRGKQLVRNTNETIANTVAMQNHHTHRRGADLETQIEKLEKEANQLRRAIALKKRWGLDAPEAQENDAIWDSVTEVGDSVDSSRLSGSDDLIDPTSPLGSPARGVQEGA
ncbi:hypothetical protein QBC46DRAFT_430376 [Diplogelasinospora grovesii]|uniref:Uncharacterized protein n=1 Tax=Diplogelasinospora grovesii TaxID=303347 RepID=A0AAN6NH53_9PEZI|nr:hypothetical protein QBC46DRAFT_430376 [Diplogelasinospora grovesii]